MITPFISIFTAFSLALISFYVNRRIQKMLDIKIIINSLFDIYVNKYVLDDFELANIHIRLMDEIINIEKINDHNHYINIELKKLKKLRLVFFKAFKTNQTDVEQLLNEIRDIKFKPLDNSFILLAFFDIKISYFLNLHD